MNYAERRAIARAKVEAKAKETPQREMTEKQQKNAASMAQRKASAARRADGHLDRTKARPRPPGRQRITVDIEGKMAQLITGELTVEDMDNEELARLQFRDKDGGFRGRPPANIPTVLVNRMRSELFKRTNSVMAESLHDAVTELARIALEAERETDRVKAISMLLDRLQGRVPEKVELSTGEKGFEVTLARITRGKRTT